MFSAFISRKMKTAEYKLIKDGTYFGQISTASGVWASADNLEDCRRELKEVLEDWVLIKIQAHERVPGLRLRFDRRRMVKYA